MDAGSSVVRAEPDAVSCSLREYLLYFLRLGTLGFGGSIALAGAAGNQECVAAAPPALVFCAHPARSAPRYGERGKHLHALQDATIACTFAVLAATALGLGSVWVGAFDEDAVARVITAPKTVIPVAILPIGYAAEKPASTPRRQLDTSSMN